MKLGPPIPAKHIAGMKPWLCEYDGPDGRYGIDLYGTDPEQVLNDNCEALPGLKVLGELMETIEVIDPPPDWKPGDPIIGDDGDRQ